MKKPAYKLTLIASMLAIASVMTVPALRAADADADKAAKKAKKEAADLAKYDKNGNGKLDPDEEAMRKADADKKKEEKKKKN